MSGVDHSLLTNHNDFDCLMRHLRPDIDEGGTGIESLDFFGIWHTWSWSAVDQLKDKNIASF